MEQLNILVIGGAGFIGSHLVDALVERGHRVRVLDALVSQVHSDGAPRYLNPAAQFIQGDVCDPAAVSAASERYRGGFPQGSRSRCRPIDVRNCSLRAREQQAVNDSKGATAELKKHQLVR